MFKTSARDAVARFQPEALLVGASCTAELIQDDPGGLARALGLSIPVVALELPAYQQKENWGAAATFCQLVRAFAGPHVTPGATERPAAPCCSVLGPAFDMSQEATGALAMLKKLRGRKPGARGTNGVGSDGRAQMRMLRRLPKLMKFIPGTAQDVRTCFLALQYWLAWAGREPGQPGPQAGRQVL